MLIDNLASYFDRDPAREAVRANHTDTRPTLPSGFIKSVIDMKDAEPRLTRQAAPGYIHASALIDMCPRQWALMLGQEMRVEETVTGAHRVLWAFGRAVEDHVRSQLISGWRSAVYGNWTCVCGGNRHHGFKPASTAQTCGQCGQVPHIYMEMQIVDDEYRVVGSPDIVVRHEDVWVPVEIKSMNRPDWEDLKKPLAAHVAQAAAYRRLIRDVLGLPVHDDVVVLYCSKDFKWGSPYKEFHVNVGTDIVEARMQALFEKAKSVFDAMAQGTIPEERVCGSPAQPRAKKCAVCGPCFARTGTFDGERTRT